MPTISHIKSHRYGVTKWYYANGEKCLGPSISHLSKYQFSHFLRPNKHTLCNPDRWQDMGEYVENGAGYRIPKMENKDLEIAMNSDPLFIVSDGNRGSVIHFASGRVLKTGFSIGKIAKFFPQMWRKGNKLITNEYKKYENSKRVV